MAAELRGARARGLVLVPPPRPFAVQAQLLSYMTPARRVASPALLRSWTRPALPSPTLRRSSSLSTTSASSTSGTPPPRRRSYFTYTALLTTGVVSGLLLSLYVPRPRLLSLLYPTPTPAPHAADSEDGRRHTAELEHQLQNLDIVKQLRNERIPAPDESEFGTTSANNSATPLSASSTSTTSQTVPRWIESRPYSGGPPGPHSLTGYSLRGPGKFAMTPLIFSTADKRQGVFVIHIGKGLCGHEGVTHGGLLGTILDECLGRTALLALPSNIGVTATLELAYKKPTFADQFVVIRAELKELKGRKAWVEGRIEDLNGEVLVEGKALFVEPRMAKFLDSSSVRKALG